MSKADGPVGVVLVPVRAALATWEGDDSAGGHVLPALAGANRDRPLEHDQELLALEVVVEVHAVPRRQLVDSQPEVPRTGAGPDARAAIVAFVFQLCGVDVLHAGEFYPRRRSVRKVIE